MVLVPWISPERILGIGQHKPETQACKVRGYYAGKLETAHLAVVSV